MSDIQSAVKAIQKMANLYQPFVDVADELNKIGSMDTAIKEGEAALKKINDRKAKAEAEATLVESKLADIRKTAAGEIDKLGADIQAAKDAAKEEAKQITDRAKSDAAEIINKALAEGAAGKASLSAQLVELQKQITVAQGVLDDAEKARIAAQDELDSINKKIDQAKAKVAALLS